jgi:hypothetical protein
MRKLKHEKCSDFFRTSPKSSAAIIPTTMYVPAVSSRHATTKGRLLLFVLIPVFVIGTRSLKASTSHSAKRERMLGCAKRARSGPWDRTTTRWFDIVRMSCLSMMDVPWRIIARWSDMDRFKASRNGPILSSGQIKGCSQLPMSSLTH